MMALTREEKRAYRNKMMKILRGRPVDELTVEEFKELQQIRKLIDSTSMDESHPLEKMNIKDFTYRKYNKLLDAGYTVKAIREALGVRGTAWVKWRDKNLPEKDKNREARKQNKRKIIAVYHDGQIVVQGLCEDICWDLGLKPSTVYTYANREATDGKKRTFKYLEEEK